MYSALLECTHTATWRDSNHMPKQGERTWCFRCGYEVTVSEVYGPWRAICYDCSQVNWHAMYMTTIMRRAVEHVQQHVGHKVRVWQYGQGQDTGHLVTYRETGTQRALW